MVTLEQVVVERKNELVVCGFTSYYATIYYKIGVRKEQLLKTLTTFGQSNICVHGYDCPVVLFKI